MIDTLIAERPFLARMNHDRKVQLAESDAKELNSVGPEAPGPLGWGPRGSSSEVSLVLDVRLSATPSVALLRPMHKPHPWSDISACPPARLGTPGP